MLLRGGDTCRRWEMLLGGGRYMQTLGDVVEGGGDTCRRWEMLLRGGGDTCRRWEMLLRGGGYMQTLGDVVGGGGGEGIHADVGRCC